MTFLQKYILFPKRFGFYPYFWLIWIIFPITSLWPVNTVHRGIAVGLLVVFIWFYRNGYSVTKTLPIWIVGQYVLCLILTITNSWIYLTLFTAWEIGSLPLSKRKFNGYLIGYYLTLAACIFWLLVQAKFAFFGMGDDSGVGGGIVMILFEIFSPLAGKSISNSYHRSQELQAQNSRYADVIKRGERERIARDLHDTLGQSFSTITVKAELASKLLVKKPDQVQKELAEIATASRNNLQLVRQIVTGLRQLSIAEMMIEVANKLKAGQINLETNHEELANAWPAKIQNVVAEVLREATTNVVNYSHAGQLQVSFTETDKGYQVNISDNGIGYSRIRNNAHGIAGMKERAAIAGGKLEITTSRNGTEIELVLPKDSYAHQP
jgi:two-component system sensor histidine kinase DesK